VRAGRDPSKAARLMVAGRPLGRSSRRLPGAHRRLLLSALGEGATVIEKGLSATEAGSRPRSRLGAQEEQARRAEGNGRAPAYARVEWDSKYRSRAAPRAGTAAAV
jgi:hypothetical protein